MTKNRSTIHFITAFVLIFILFFSLRVFKLNTIPVFVDEAIYIRWSQVMKNEATLRFLPQSDGKQPLFMWITISAFKVFSDPLIAGRMVSVFAGLGTMLGLALLSYLLFKNKLVSLATAFLYAVTPFFVFFDRMALADSLLGMFSVWSLVLGYWFVSSFRLDAAMLTGFAVGGGLLTKSPAIFFYLWIFVFLIFGSKKIKTKTDIFQLTTGLFAILIISQLMFNILRLGPNFHMINSRNYDYVFPVSEVIHHPLNPLIGNLKKTASWFWYLLTPATCFLILFGLTQYKKSIKVILPLLLVSLSVIFAQGGVAKVYTSRYILFPTLPLLPIAAYSLVGLMSRFHHLFLGLLVWPLFVAYGYAYTPVKSIVPFDMHDGYLEQWTAGWGQKEIAQYLVNLSQSQSKKIVVGTEGFFGTLPDGLQIYTQGNPEITVIGVGQPLFSLPDSLKNTSKDNLIFLVVNQSRNNLTQEDLKQLQLIAEYPKPNHPDGTKEVLQFYQFK